MDFPAQGFLREDTCVEFCVQKKLSKAEEKSEHAYMELLEFLDTAHEAEK